MGLLPLAAGAPLIAAVAMGGAAFGISRKTNPECAPINVVLWVLVGLLMLGPAIMVLLMSMRVREAAENSNTRKMLVVHDGPHIQAFESS